MSDTRADTRELLRRWAPHVFLGLLVITAGWWLLSLIAPLRLALLTGGSLALLTNPMLFMPINRGLTRLVPTWPDDLRRYLSSLLATIVLLALAVLAVLLVLFGLLGEPRMVLREAIGLAFQDPKRINVLINVIADRSAGLLALYPSLGLSSSDVRSVLGSFIGHSSFGPEFVKLVFTGTGGVIVQTMLTFTTLFYLYIQGPLLADFLLQRLPLSETGRSAVQNRFERTVHYLLAQIFGRALVMGITLGALAWLIAGFDPVLVGIVGLFAGLLPVVGHAFVWLPLASILASSGRWLEAISLAVACWAASWLIENLSQRLARALDAADTWMSFLLFCSLIGGVLGSGVRGLVFGPAAVIVVVVLGQLVASLYGPETAIGRITTGMSGRPPEA